MSQKFPKAANKDYYFPEINKNVKTLVIFWQIQVSLVYVRGMKEGGL